MSYTYIYGALRQVLNKQLLSEPCQQLVIIKVTDTSVIVILQLIKLNTEHQDVLPRMKNKN